MSSYLRPHARTALAIFTFLVKAYNCDNETLAEIEEVLGRTRHGREFLSLERLHDIFYKEFMKGFCVK